MTTPIHLRQLRADMALKDLKLAAVAEKAGVDYARASEILKGRRNDPPRLAKLKRAIKTAPMPEEAVAQ